ncbi:MAG TPA: hypothetical protein VGN20_23915 [Mucilaginibacter sp.]|jgi:hypothetical protein
MNKFIQSIKNFDFHSIEALVQKEPKWISWAEEGGKNALHYLCGVSALKRATKGSAQFTNSEASFKNRNEY